MVYVDGFVFVVKSSKLQEYRKMALDAGKVWKKFGALQYIETIGDDMYPKSHDISIFPVNFPKLTKLKAGEKVGYSFIVYKNKAHRNSVNKKVMDYFGKKYKDVKDMPQMPFDMKKMTYGGFKSIVEL
jgi:alkaline phosphatase